MSWAEKAGEESLKIDKKKSPTLIQTRAGV